MVKIKYSPYTVACRIEDTIYLNPDLKKHPQLHRAILKHEKEHSDSFTWHDLVMDLKGEEMDGLKKEYYKFLWNHPKAWRSFMPMSKFEGAWAIDISLSLVYIFAVGVLWLLLKFL